MVMSGTEKQNVETHFTVAGLSERFDETLILLKRLFGWRRPFYVNRNVTRLRFKRQEISAEMRRVIEQYNMLDLELYTWASERFAALMEQQDATFEREVRVFRRLNGLYGQTAPLARWLKARILEEMGARTWQTHY